MAGKLINGVWYPSGSPTSKKRPAQKPAKKSRVDKLTFSLERTSAGHAIYYGRDLMSVHPNGWTALRKLGEELLKLAGEMEAKFGGQPEGGTDENRN